MSSSLNTETELREMAEKLTIESCALREAADVLQNSLYRGRWVKPAVSFFWHGDKRMKYILPNFFVTRATKRKYIKPMFASIPQIMMIVGSASPAITKIFSRLFLSPPFNLVTNSLLCSRLVSIKRAVMLSILSSFLCISLTIRCCTFATSITSFFCLLISLTGRFADFITFFSLIFSNRILYARLTPRMKPTFVFGYFIKLRNRAGLLAFCALFLYDLLSHFNLPNRLFWLEPVAAQTAIGSFYSIHSFEGNQYLL